MKVQVRATPCALAVSLALMLPMAQASSSFTQEYSLPSSAPGSRLYYRIAGSHSIGQAPYRGATSFRLALTGTARLNYSCGKFDASLTISQITAQYSQLSETIVNGVKAGIANLPMYILQRTQPGLYELMQTYIRKAEEIMNLSFKSCEQMASEIKDGKNPWDGWVTLSMGEDWKWKSNFGDGNVATAKKEVESNAGKKGFDWVYGSKAGGVGQPPARIVGDTTQAAYNLTMGRATTASTSAGSTAQSRLSAAFPTAADAVRFSTSVLGETEVSSCSTDDGCPAKATKMALGLQKEYDNEITSAQQQLTTVLASTSPSASDLNAASGPGVAITRDLANAIRGLPKAEAGMVSARLASEVALARTVDRALLLRQLLVSGQTIPSVEASKTLNNLEHRIADLDLQIKNLMFEAQTRKQLVSSTATDVFDAVDSMRTTAPLVQPADPNRFTNGKVSR